MLHCVLVLVHYRDNLHNYAVRNVNDIIFQNHLYFQSRLHSKVLLLQKMHLFRLFHVPQNHNDLLSSETKL